MREFRWRFDFHNQWHAWWTHLHNFNESITLLTFHFKRDYELGLNSLGMTILNFRIGFEKDVPQGARRTISGELILDD